MSQQSRMMWVMRWTAAVVGFIHIHFACIIHANIDTPTLMPVIMPDAHFIFSCIPIKSASRFPTQKGHGIGRTRVILIKTTVGVITFTVCHAWPGERLTSVWDSCNTHLYTYLPTPSIILQRELIKLKILNPPNATIALSVVEQQP